MAFLGSIGKFIGGATKTLAPILAPVVSLGTDVLINKVTGGSGLSGLGSFLPGAGSGPSAYPSLPMFGGLQTSLGGPYQLPQQYPQQPQQPVVQTAGVPALTRDVFDIILKLATRLGIVIKTPASVVRIGRNIIAKLLRFARANPGLTIINLLANLGLAANEVSTLLTWYTTHGKRHRRIKVTNVKALNRSVRRLEGFRRLSHRVEMALARRGVSRSPSRARRCPRCKKSPCCC